MSALITGEKRMFSKGTGIYTRYETDEQKQKIELLADRLRIAKGRLLYDVLRFAVANIKNENDVEGVMKKILEEKSRLEKQNEFREPQHYESIMFQIYYDLKINPQIDAMPADESNPFAAMEKDKLNRIFSKYLGEIAWYMSRKNITAVKTTNVEEIFGEDLAKVKYVIDSSPFMLKDSEDNYRFISDYVKCSMMFQLTLAKAQAINLSGVPDFDDECLDAKSNSRGLGLS